MLYPTLAAILVVAADFWQQKPPSSWTAKECDRLMSKSPWARDAPLTGTPPSAPGGSGGGLGINPSGSGGSGAPAMQTASVRWESAAPYREAMKKSKVEGASSDADADEFHIITVTGIQLPAANAGPMAAELTRTKDRLKMAKLTPKGRKAVAPAKVLANISPDSTTIRFYFPRTVTPEDKEVLFETELATMDLKARFAPKDMVFDGKPAF